MNNLRVSLLLDVIMTGFVGLVHLGAGNFLSPWLGISSFILQASGVFYVLFVAFIASLLIRGTANFKHVKAIAIVNVLWAGDLLLFMFFKNSELTQLGVSFVAIQFVAVLFFAFLQFQAFKKVVV